MGSDATQGTERYSHSERVVRAVAEAEDVPPEEVTPPLHEVVDTEALDELFGGDRTGGRVSFDYCGYDVTVDVDGNVEVRDE